MEIQGLNIEKLKEMMQNVKSSSERVEKIIKPFMSDNLSRKQGIELCQVGKFLSLLEVPTTIIERRESPDFIISNGGELIGLEHESILDEKIASDYRSVSDLFNDAATLFSQKYPDVKLLANIYLSVDKLVFKKHERTGIIEKIVDYIFNYITDVDTIKPDFIDSLSVTKHSRVDFVYNPGAHYVDSLNEERLISAILKKEKKIADYKKKTGLQKQWLLLTIGTLGPDSFEYGDAPFHVDITTDYDGIFLLEDFHNNLWRIK
jgi:hypothetical protein